MQRLRQRLGSVALVSMAALLGAAGGAHASGYFVPEMDAEAMAQASAWVARARGPSAIFFNPAGLTQIQKFEISGGTTLIDLQSEFTGPTPLSFVTETENSIVPPSHGFLGYKIGEKIAVGIGMHTSFGLIMEWPQRWPEDLNFGSFILEKVDLKTYNINPTIAYAVNENLSFGAGFQWVLASAQLERRINLNALPGLPPGLPPLPPGDSFLDADNGGGDFGFNVGVLYKTEKVGIGVSYRSQVDLALDGTVDFTIPTIGIPPLDAVLQGTFSDQGGGTEIPLPDLIMAGIAYRPSEKAEIELDVNWANWKDFDQFTIAFDGTLSAQPLRSEQRWDDGFTLRLGGAYKVSDTMEARLGGIYDPTVIPDETLRPLLPESDRYGVNAGVGFKLGSIDVDLAYLFLKISERTTTTQEDGFNGTYNGQAHLFGVTLSFAGGS